MERWKTEASEKLLDTRWVKVRRDQVTLPGGMRIDDFYAITIADAAAVVAIDEAGQIILKKEYRYCYDRELIEIPAGTFEVGETDSLAVAQRELLEETGYASEEWEYIGSTVESSSKLTNLDVLVVPLEKAVEMVMRNEICCNSSAHGILWAARKLGR